MADRRMLARTITENDNFVALPAAAQALYMHLTLSADDDGFCSQVSTAMFRAHAKKKDLEALVAARYLLRFDSGVMVIKHWRMANAIRKDRYTPTVYQEEYARLTLKDNSAYTMATNWQPNDTQLVPQVRLGKDRLGKDSVGEDIDNNSIYLSEEKEEKEKAETGAVTNEKFGEVMSFFLDRIEPEPQYSHIDFLKASIASKGTDRVLAALRMCVDTGKTGFPWVMKAVNES